MIISNEPGFYKTNEYGIRIENLVLVEKSKKPGFLKFKTITLAPIDENLIDFTILSETEILWLKNYHQEIYKKLNLANFDPKLNP
jgi:Xaa-Pro aminopeptidase